MFANKKFQGLFMCLCMLLLIALPAFAAESTGAAAGAYQEFKTMVNTVLEIARWTGLILSCIAFMFAGVKLAFNSGDPNSWKILIAAAMGVFFCAVAIPFVNFILGNLGVEV